MTTITDTGRPSFDPDHTYDVVPDLHEIVARATERLTPEQIAQALQTWIDALDDQEGRREVYGRGAQVKVRKMVQEWSRAA